MSYATFGYRLPGALSRQLFGDREQFGLVVQHEDPCWREWETTYLSFYEENQHRSVGKVVNEAGYRVLESFDMTGKRVLEIGPGDIPHLFAWRGMPECFVVADIQDAMIERTAKKLEAHGVPHETHLLTRAHAGALPFDDESFDAIVSFYSLEHLYPLRPYLDDMRRVLKPGGTVIGAIPAEGGLAWGLGRWLTSRRWLLRNTSINPDKIICWEHPNFADHVLGEMDAVFGARRLGFWPLGVPSVDLNLVIRFRYEKR